MSKVNAPFRRVPNQAPAPAPAAPSSADDAEKFIAGSLMESRIQPAAPVSTQPAMEDESIYRTVNVKLNKRRYSNFKMLSAMTEKPMQQYMVELIDELLERNAERLKKF